MKPKKVMRKIYGERTTALIASAAILVGTCYSGSGSCYETNPGAGCAPGPRLSVAGSFCAVSVWAPTSNVDLRNVEYEEGGMSEANYSSINPTKTTKFGTWNSVAEQCVLSESTFSATDYNYNCTTATLMGDNCCGEIQ